MTTVAAPPRPTALPAPATQGRIGGPAVDYAAQFFSVVVAVKLGALHEQLNQARRDLAARQALYVAPDEWAAEIEHGHRA